MIITARSLSAALAGTPSGGEKEPAAEADEPFDDDAYELGEVCELPVALHHHTVQIVGRAAGTVLFQGSLDGEHWKTMCRLDLDSHAGANFLGSPMRSEQTPTSWYYLRVVPKGDLAVIDGPLAVYFGSS